MSEKTKKFWKRKEKAAGPKKKIKKRYIVLAAAVLLLAAVLVSSGMAAGKGGVPVTCSIAETGRMQENVSASGKVVSAQSRTYFAEVSAKVARLHVAAGDEVKAGDLLLSYDTADLEQSKTKADLDAAQVSNSYQSAMLESGKNQNEYADASLGLDELKQMEANQKQYVQGLKYQVEDDTAAKKEDLHEWDKKLAEELSYQNRKLAEKQSSGEDTENVEKVIDSLNSQRTDVQNELSMLDQDENIKQKQRLIDFEEKKLADMTEEIQRRESKQNASEGGIMNGYSQQEKALGVESAKLSAQAAADALERAKNGVVADFDGIVTNVSIVEGATAAEGTQLFTIESNQDVKVTVELSKYDLEKVREGQEADLTIAGSSYKGKVVKINRMAQNNQQNTPVVNADITIENADSSLFLGVEGKASIHTAEVENAILLPFEAINTDKEGDFCYLVKEGVLVKQRIVTGISDDVNMEIKEGIAKGDQVVTGSVMTLEEGMKVIPVSAEDNITPMPAG